MITITDLCFLCTKDHNCVPVDDKIVSQVEYVLPEITIFRLSIPLRICSVCYEALYSFSKFKQSSVESSRRLEAHIKGAQGPSLPDPAIQLQNHNTVSQNQFHINGMSPKNQPHIETNSHNVTEIFIKTEPSQEETRQDKEVCDMLTDQSSESEQNIDGSSATPNTTATSIDNPLKIEEVFIKEEPLEQLPDFQCDICNESFTLMTNLDLHMKTHSEIKNFPCSVCPKSFTSRGGLRQHVRIHSEIKDFHCETCNKSFAMKSNFDYHMKTHSGVKDFECSICNKNFTCRSHLKQHMKIHSEVKDFRCDICNKTFTMKNSLDYHMKTHAGIKDFKCEICKKAFACRSTLTHHMKTHIEVKDFSCDICNKTFKLKSYLLSHMKIHNEAEKLPCSLCNKTFATRSYLNQHMKRHS